MVKKTYFKKLSNKILQIKDFIEKSFSDAKSIYQKCYTEIIGLINKYKQIREKIQQQKKSLYLVLKAKNNKIQEELKKIRQKIINLYIEITGPYKKTKEAIRFIIKELDALHQKTLVAGIVKIVFLFRKHFKK